MTLNKYCIVIFLFAVSLAFPSCSSNQREQKYHTDLMGQWQRVGDSVAGLIVQVEQISNQDNYIGRVVYVPETVSYYAKPGEVIWQSIVPKSNTQWEGIVTLRGKTLLLGRTTTDTAYAKLILVNKDLLEIYVEKSTVKYVRHKLEDKKKSKKMR